MQVMTRRMPLVLIVLGVIFAILVGQLLSFQFRLNPSIEAFEESTVDRGIYTERIQPNRGQIYDRDGVVLAVNSFEYRIGISPALVIDRQQAAIDLAALIDLSEGEVYDLLLPDENGIYPPFILLASPIDENTANAIEDLDLNGIQIESIPLRTYPQGALTSQLLGFVNEGGSYFGVEAQYDRVLAGTAREVETDGNLLEIAELPQARDGQSLRLTVDRDVQFLVQEVLADAMQTQGAQGGTILVMDPRTGAILGMQSWPITNPGDFASIEELAGDQAYNPAISEQYEPGSVMKVVTAAIALQADVPGLDLNWTYNNTGCFTAEGVDICDSDSLPKGPKSFRACLIESLNTCTVTWYLDWLQPSQVYGVLQDFGFGQQSGIDLEGEAAGTLNTPSDPQWSSADYLNVSYGQAVAVTPLQMLTAVNAIANDGLLMQPHIVEERYEGNRTYSTTVNPISRPISKEVADAITSIMVDVVQPDTFGELAYIEGYSIAGKTGTAQQPVPGGYSQTDSWATFIGFLPADDPAVSVLVMLDRPTDYWGSQTAAPVFRQLVERLVVLLEIPPDDVRLQLMNTGGDPLGRSR